MEKIQFKSELYDFNLNTEMDCCCQNDDSANSDETTDSGGKE